MHLGTVHIKVKKQKVRKIQECIYLSFKDNFGNQIIRLLQ